MDAGEAFKSIAIDLVNVYQRRNRIKTEQYSSQKSNENPSDERTVMKQSDYENK